MVTRFNERRFVISFQYILDVIWDFLVLNADGSCLLFVRGGFKLGNVIIDGGIWNSCGRIMFGI